MGNYSRRNFITGIGALLLISPRIFANKTADKRFYVLLHDEARCIGCNECVHACNKVNQLSADFNRLQIIRLPDDDSKKTDQPARYFRQSCQHCEEAPCIAICPTGASYRNADGIVLVDPQRCLGCDYCVAACPYKVRYINPITHIADKCDFCKSSRLDRHYIPICVRVCPSQALTFGRFDSFQIQLKLATHPYYQHQLPQSGRPHIYRLTEYF